MPETAVLHSNDFLRSVRTRLTNPKCDFSLLCEIRDEFKQWLLDAFDQTPVPILVKSRARFADLLLEKIWQLNRLDHDKTVSLIAVGGYGRGELHPWSDLDLLILSEKNISKATEENIGSFVTMLWDLKFQVGHSVRTIKETHHHCREDITVATNLLEMRFLTGNFKIFEDLKYQLKVDFPWSETDFYLAKREEQNDRHKQYKGSAYTLEPNLKANPGCLRDIQTIGWVAKRHFHTRTFQQLVERGYLTQDEREELIECRDILWHIRLALHLETRRPEDRLLFDHQPAVAKRLGFGSDPKLAVAHMMRRLFRVMQRVMELNQILLHHFDNDVLGNKPKGKRIRLDNDFMLNGGLIESASPHTFFRRQNIIRMFVVIAEHPEVTGIHPDTMRRLRTIRRRLMGDLQDYEVCRTHFVSLIKHPRGMGLPITLMHRHGILSAYLPQWKNIVGQMQFDLFHAYTVDDHTHRLLKNLYAMFGNETDPSFELCFDIVKALPKPEIIYFAGLFHDIAKGRGGDHSELGKIDALQFSELHNLPEDDADTIAWLVEQHLLMSTTAQRKDIHDPDVIQTFADIVGTEERLDLLYCLTVADIRATNDNLWNTWKASLLRELYTFTKNTLSSEHNSKMELRAVIRANQQDAMEILADNKLNSQQINAIWEQFGSEYFAYYNTEQIAWHTKHILNCNIEQPLVLIENFADSGGTQVFVYSEEQRHIFATIVKALDSKNVSIVNAQIISAKNGYILDTFVILDSMSSHAIAPDRMESIKQSIVQSLSAGCGPKLRKHRLSRKIKHFNVEAKVDFLIAKKKDRTLIEITALDIPGLLAIIADVFQEAQCYIHSAKITTIGEKAEDLFLLSNKDGLALSEQEKASLTEQILNRLTTEIDTFY